MFAKRFFHACAGFLCPALAYHVGARASGAQTGVIEAAEAGGARAAVINRQFYWVPNGSGPAELLTSIPIPGSSPVLACSASGLEVVLANGEVWGFSTQIGNWRLVSIFGGVTSSTKSNWGDLKARYR